MAISERKQRARRDLRRIILAAAEDLFVRDGYETVSMRKIAARVEYSPTTIYHHFKDKAELFGCLLSGYHGELLRRMDRIYSRAADPVDALRKGMRAYSAFGLANPSFYKLAFHNPPPFTPQAYLVDGEEGTRLFSGLRGLLEDGIRRGVFRKMDPDLAAQMVWTMNHGVTSLLISNPHFPWADRERLIGAVVECTIHGLKTGPGAGRSARQRNRKNASGGRR